MKKAFTFAELMISLVLISILSAILYPTILQFTPNTNKPLFKSAYRTLSNAIAGITNDNVDGKIASDTAATGPELCKIFCEKMNVVPELKEHNDCAIDKMCSDSTVTTSNGMKWYFYPYLAAGYTGAGYSEGTIANVFKIVVDVNSSNNDLDNAGGTIIGLPIAAGQLFEKGVFYYAPDKNTETVKTNIYDNLPGETVDGKLYPEGIFNPANLKSQDTFEILVNLDGEIVSMSPAAWANLEDNETTEQ